LSKEADKALADAEAKAKNQTSKHESEKSKQERAQEHTTDKDYGHVLGTSLKKQLDIASKVDSKGGVPASGGLMQVQTSEQLEADMRLKI